MREPGIDLWERVLISRAISGGCDLRLKDVGVRGVVRERYRVGSSDHLRLARSYSGFDSERLEPFALCMMIIHGLRSRCPMSQMDMFTQQAAATIPL